MDAFFRFNDLLSFKVIDAICSLLFGYLLNACGVFKTATIVRNNSSTLGIEDWIGVLTQFLEPCNGALVTIQLIAQFTSRRFSYGFFAPITVFDNGILVITQSVVSGITVGYC